MSNKVVILGGGIAGLAAAWFLKLQGQDVTLLESSSRVGGWIETIHQDGFLFDLGPRSCRTSGNGVETLNLIEQLGLEGEVISAAPAVRKRFLYTQRRLQSIPSGPMSFLTSPLTRPLLWPLLREWSIGPCGHADESVHDFIKRRFGGHAANTFADSLVAGIYAGDSTRLSVKSCFPFLHQWERDSGSILRGLFAQRSKQAKASRQGIISLRRGMQQLVDALATRLGSCIRMNSPVVAIERTLGGLSVVTQQGEVFQADQVISALPTAALATLIVHHDHELARLLQSIHSTSVAVVALGYRANMLDQEGFGYLIPSREGERVLGMVWDSSVFPQQNSFDVETRLTCMIGGERMPNFDSYVSEDFGAIALEAVGRHLGKKRTPDSIAIKIARRAIPQYYLGHGCCMEEIQRRMMHLFPQLTLIGSSFNGVSVNDCIERARIVASKIGAAKPVFA